jgi:hypothetical protein
LADRRRQSSLFSGRSRSCGAGKRSATVFTSHAWIWQGLEHYMII